MIVSSLCNLYGLERVRKNSLEASFCKGSTNLQMAKLKGPQPRLTLVSTRLAPINDRKEWDRQRDLANSWRGWYDTSKWKELRWEVLTRDKFTCKRCDEAQVDTSLLVADHIIPHRGDASLFWNKKNLQTLCKSCHDSIKQAEELRELTRGF